MENVLTLTKKRVFVKLATYSIALTMLAVYTILWLAYPRMYHYDLTTIFWIITGACTIFFATALLFIANMVFNVAHIRILSFLDEYIFYFINLFFPLMIVLGKIVHIDRREIERSFIALNNYILNNRQIKVNPAELLVISPHCLQLASCPHKITYDIKNCKRCNACSIGPLIELAEKHGFNFRVVTGGTLARKIAKDLRPKMILAIACERDLASGIQDVFPLPAAGVLNVRPNGPCYNTGVDVSLVEETILKFIK